MRNYKEEAKALGLGAVPGLEKHIRHYRNARDIVGISRNAMIIDLYGLSIEDVQCRFPLVYQWIFELIKPEREKKRRGLLRDEWWLFARTRPEMRKALEGCSRYIVTSQTAKHRIFSFLSASILPDARLVVIASDDAYMLGILSSRIHTVWAKATGSRMGERLVYTQGTCLIHSLF